MEGCVGCSWCNRGVKDWRIRSPSLSALVEIVLVTNDVGWVVECGRMQVFGIRSGCCCVVV